MAKKQTKQWKGPPVPYQFEMPADMHDAGLKKSRGFGLSMAQFMRIAWQDFIDRPAHESLNLLATRAKRKK